MNLKLPKSNVAWEVITDNVYGRTELRATFTMPDGEQLHCQHTVDDRMLAQSYAGFASHIVERTLVEIEREVGRRMVRGK